MKRKAALFGSITSLIAVIVLLPSIRSVETLELNDETRQQASGRFITTAIGTTHYEISGPEQGHPVVLVHGFASPMYVWDKTAPALAAAGYRVIRFDLMGRGYSDRPDVVYNVDFFGEQIKQLLEGLAITQAVSIVGYSMGGSVTAGFVNRYPELVERVALVAPYNTAKSVFPLAIPVVGDWLAQVVLPQRMANRQSSSYYQPEKFTHVEQIFREQLVFKGFANAIHSSLKTIIAVDHLAAYQQLGKSDKDVLLMWGKQDQVLSFDESPRVKEALGNPPFVVLEQSGHTPAVEEPEKVNAALLGWLGG